MKQTRDERRGTLLLGIAGLALLTPTPLAERLQGVAAKWYDGMVCAGRKV
jgi:hypothetical protein